MCDVFVFLRFLNVHRGSNWHLEVAQIAESSQNTFGCGVARVPSAQSPPHIQPPLNFQRKRRYLGIIWDGLFGASTGHVADSG